MEKTYMVTRVLAGTVAEHFQFYVETLRHSDRVDAKVLLPLISIFGTFFQGDFCCELDYISNLKKGHCIIIYIN